MKTDIQPGDFIYTHVHEVEPSVTSHGTGSKQVLCPEMPGAMQMKQVALGTLMPGESVALHAHPDMDEYYYFTEGEGNMCVLGADHFLFKGTFIKVPAGHEHTLQCSTVALQFLYFALAAL